MNIGAWQATVHGVTKSRTRLKQLHTHTHTSPSQALLPIPSPWLLSPACPAGSLLPSHLGLGQSLQLLGQLLHVTIHHWLLDLEIDRRGQEGMNPGSPNLRIPSIFESTHTS